MFNARSQIRGPRIACEITPDRVIAARAHDDSASLQTVSTRQLSPGAVVPHLGEPNVAAAATVQGVISDALASVGGHSREVIAILPDAAVRVALLDFDALPDRRQDADAMVRFRLKKTLPFDVEQAAVSYHVRRENGAVKVVAAVALSSVLEEYESLFRHAGYNPGVVLPSTLASLGAVDAPTPTLVIKVDAATTTVAIVAGNNLLLFRALENPETAPDAQHLADDVYPSLVYFHDTYGLQVERILVGGTVSAEDVGAVLQAQTGVAVQDLVGASAAGYSGTAPRSILAGVIGALLS